jgi:serine/threonine protein kinase
MLCPFCRAANTSGADACLSCGRSLVTLKQGHVLAGRYEVLATLGQGGMGTVYKAHDRELDEIIALKILREDLTMRAEIGMRFRSEIKLARRIRHKNVCAIHEYGQDGALRYITMEFIDGVDLKKVLRDLGALPPGEAFDVSVQVAEGLQAIHDEGIVHRDLKTSNIMRDHRGAVRLMDFGIAKQWEAETSTNLTVAGQIVGTPDYMSPEQIEGSKVDSRSDIYSLGTVIFELFTGQVLFRSDTPVVTMFRQLHDPPPLEGPRADRLPPALVPILRRALAKAAQDRYPVARELADALREAQRASWPPTEALTPARYLRTAEAPEIWPAPDSTEVPTQVPTQVPTVPTEVGAPPEAPPASRLEPARAAATENITLPVARGPQRPQSVDRPDEGAPAARVVSPPPVARASVRPPPLPPKHAGAAPGQKPVSRPKPVRSPAPTGFRVTGVHIWLFAAVVFAAAVSIALIRLTSPLDWTTPTTVGPSAAATPTPAPGSLPSPGGAQEPSPSLEAPRSTTPPSLGPQPTPTPPFGGTVPAPVREAGTKADVQKREVAPPAPLRSPSPSAPSPRPRTGPTEAASTTLAPKPPDRRSEVPSTAPSAPPTQASPGAATSTAQEVGLLQLGVRPYADVVIDGELVGTTPMKAVPLSAGLHTVRLLHPSFQPFQRKVTIRAGTTTKLEVDLELDAIAK